MYEVFSCYKNGDLAKALEEAAGVVRDIGYDNNVLHVIARLDENVPDAWWVDVIYRQTQQSHNITGVSMPREWTNP